MPPFDRDETSLARNVARHDYLRGSPWSRGGPGQHKEWLHFCILGPELDLLINFSVSDDTSAAVLPGTTLARLTVLAFDGTWDGDVETFEVQEAEAREGDVDFRFGVNSCSFRGGSYRLRIALRDRPIEVDLTITPITHPLRAPSIPQLDGPPLHWVTIPRSIAQGTARFRGREHRIERAPAYHDHNWGHFLWGNDLSWRWGFALPEDPGCPWSLVFAGITDRARHHALSQGLFLWRGTKVVRAFRERVLSFEADHRPFAQSKVLKVPRVMALVSPELPTEVPRSMIVRAASDGEVLECRFEPESVAQVVIPSERSFGVTAINEVKGRATLDGCIDGETISTTCRSVLEFLVP